MWEFKTGFCVSSPAIGSDGTIYVGSWDNKLYAINGKTGDKLWEFVTVGNVYSSPAIASDGTVYVGSRDAKLYAINGENGVKLWEFETGIYVDSSPTIGSDGTGYVGSWDKSSMPSMARLGSSYGNLKQEVGESSPAIGSMARFTSGQVGRPKSSMPSLVEWGQL